MDGNRRKRCHSNGPISPVPYMGLLVWAAPLFPLLETHCPRSLHIPLQLPFSPSHYGNDNAKMLRTLSRLEAFFSISKHFWWPERVLSLFWKCSTSWKAVFSPGPTAGSAPDSSHPSSQWATGQLIHLLAELPSRVAPRGEMLQQGMKDFLLDVRQKIWAHVKF